MQEEVTTATELTDAITKALQRRGVLKKIKAELRAEVFHALEDKTVVLPDKPREVYLASELIREFLMSMQLDSSLSVFTEEIGQPQEMRVDREFIGGELGFNMIDERRTGDVPLLVLLIRSLIDRKEQLQSGAEESLLNHADS